MPLGFSPVEQLPPPSSFADLSTLEFTEKAITEGQSHQIHNYTFLSCRQRKGSHLGWWSTNPHLLSHLDHQLKNRDRGKKSHMLMTHLIRTSVQ